MFNLIVKSLEKRNNLLLIIMIARVLAVVSTATVRFTKLHVYDIRAHPGHGALGVLVTIVLVCTLLQFQSKMGQE